jgi:putative Ca2+/H+ antiporter (TMEM165/GDT1 family)
MFFLILVSELGDKTQLASLALALRFNPLIVLIGAGLGFFAVNAIASKLAISVLKVPSPKIRSIFGSVFIIAGILSIILTYAYTTP